MANNKRDDDRQSRLALSRDDRLEALAIITPEMVDVGSRAWRNVFELLRQIEFCGGRSENSFARVSVLAGRMKVTERTVQRAATVAIKAGLLVRNPRQFKNGQGSNEWAIQWDKIAMLAAAASAPDQLSPTPDQLSPTPDQLSPTPDQLSPTPDQLSPRIENPQIPLRESTKGRPRVSSSVDPKRIDWNRAQGDAATVAKKIGCDLTRENWLLAAKVAALSQHYGEAWLWDPLDAIERVRPSPRNRWGYCWTCWETRALESGKSFRADLRRLEPPISVAGHRAILLTS